MSRPHFAGIALVLWVGSFDRSAASSDTLTFSAETFREAFRARASGQLPDSRALDQALPEWHALLGEIAISGDLRERRLAVRYLGELLEADQRQKRMTEAERLAALAVVCQATGDRGESTRREAACGLYRADPREFDLACDRRAVAKALQRMISDSQGCGVKAIGQLRFTEFKEVLEARSDEASKDHNREDCRLALARMGAELWREHFLDKLRNASQQTRVQALGDIYFIGSAEVLPALIVSLDDTEPLRCGSDCGGDSVAQGAHTTLRLLTTKLGLKPPELPTRFKPEYREIWRDWAARNAIPVPVERFSPPPQPVEP